MRIKLVLSGLVNSATQSTICRFGTVLAIAILMVSIAPGSAEASWFSKHVANFNGAKRVVSRVTNPNGAKRFVSRATNPHGIEHFWNTNKAGFERWARRVCPAQEAKQTENGYRPRSYRCQVNLQFGGGSGQ